MKQSDSKDRSSVVYIGKGIIIAVVIITASISFILGFFVGKSFRPSPPEQQAASPQQNVIAQPDNVITQPSADPVKKEAPVAEHVSDEKKQARDQETQQQPQQLVDTQKPGQVREVKKVRENRETRKPLETQDPDKTSKKRRYTVQIEALKSAAAADALKERLNKKGYKASVISSVTKKHEKLFKVFVGEFAARKEAEVMSVKLKKTENLQRPFVTFRSE